MTAAAVILALVADVLPAWSSAVIVV